MSFNDDDLIEAMMEPNPNNGPDELDGAWTREELEERLGWGKHKILERLHALKKAGKVKVERIKREDIAGTMRKIPCYRFVKEDNPSE